MSPLRGGGVRARGRGAVTGRRGLALWLASGGAVAGALIAAEVERKREAANAQVLYGGPPLEGPVDPGQGEEGLQEE